MQRAEEGEGDAAVRRGHTCPQQTTWAVARLQQTALGETGVSVKHHRLDKTSSYVRRQRACRVSESATFIWHPYVSTKLAAADGADARTVSE